MYSAFT